MADYWVSRRLSTFEAAPHAPCFPAARRDRLSDHSPWRGRGLQVLDRCDLTILEEPGAEDLACRLADPGVEVFASLSCYQEGNVDKQRGKGASGRAFPV